MSTLKTARKRAIIALAAVLLLTLVLTQFGVWRASSSAAQIRVPMFYDAHYAFQRAWTQEQSVPPQPEPVTVGLDYPNQLSQSWRSGTDRLSGVRFWMMGGELVWQLEAAQQRWSGTVKVSRSTGKYVTIMLPETIVGVSGEMIRLTLQPLPNEQPGWVFVRTVNGNRLWGDLRLNEFSQAANLDMETLIAGGNGGFIDALREQMLPTVFQTRLQQYKAPFLKGELFVVLLFVTVVGSIALLFVSLPQHATTGVWLIVGGLTAFLGWQWLSKGVQLPRGDEMVSAETIPLQPIAIDQQRLYKDLASELWTATRLPEERFVQPQLGTTDLEAPNRVSGIDVPADSRIEYAFTLPNRSELVLEFGGEPQVSRGHILIDDELLDAIGAGAQRRYDLSRWGGQAVKLTLETYVIDNADNLSETPIASWIEPQIYVTTDWVTDMDDSQVRAVFGNGIELRDVAFSAESITLNWSVSEQISRYPTVFVHVLDGAGEIVAQHDAAPVGGTYPVANWIPNTLIEDVHPLPPLPAGTYGVAIGLYDPATFERYAAFDSNGAALADNMLRLPDFITITE